MTFVLFPDLILTLLAHIEYGNMGTLGYGIPRESLRVWENEVWKHWVWELGMGALGIRHKYGALGMGALG